MGNFSEIAKYLSFRQNPVLISIIFYNSSIIQLVNLQKQRFQDHVTLQNKKENTTIVPSTFYLSFEMKSTLQAQLSCYAYSFMELYHALRNTQSATG